MARAKIKWDIKGFREVRQRGEVERIVLAQAEAIANACGEGYVATSSVGKNRARAAVIAATPKAMDDNRKNNRILSNLNAARR